jgi:hypothetical protein
VRRNRADRNSRSPANRSYARSAFQCRDGVVQYACGAPVCLGEEPHQAPSAPRVHGFPLQADGQHSSKRRLGVTKQMYLAMPAHWRTTKPSRGMDLTQERFAEPTSRERPERHSPLRAELASLAKERPANIRASSPSFPHCACRSEICLLLHRRDGAHYSAWGFQ